ncbi:hypothetical protein [Cerasicoccus maritimus]|uniref:hypothetical protein n=1 Tax=Cerasicoccus maritimus TaxID=490089 RepID=UPI00285293F6|nr:hypothetical protein [Cerasicoccus maritimus]
MIYLDIVIKELQTLIAYMDRLPLTLGEAETYNAMQKLKGSTEAEVQACIELSRQRTLDAIKRLTNRKITFHDQTGELTYQIVNWESVFAALSHREDELTKDMAHTKEFSIEFQALRILYGLLLIFHQHIAKELVPANDR